MCRTNAPKPKCPLMQLDKELYPYSIVENRVAQKTAVGHRSINLSAMILTPLDLIGPNMGKLSQVITGKVIGLPKAGNKTPRLGTQLEKHKIG